MSLILAGSAVAGQHISGLVECLTIDDATMAWAKLLNQLWIEVGGCTIASAVHNVAQAEVKKILLGLRHRR